MDPALGISAISVLIAGWSIALSKKNAKDIKERDEHKLEVEANLAITTDGAFIAANAVNDCFRPINVQKAHLEFSAEEKPLIYQPIQVHPVFYPLPKRLAESEPVTVLFRISEIIDKLSEKEYDDESVIIKNVTFSDSHRKRYQAPLNCTLADLKKFSTDWDSKVA